MDCRDEYVLNKAKNMDCRDEYVLNKAKNMDCRDVYVLNKAKNMDSTDDYVLNKVITWTAGMSVLNKTKEMDYRDVYVLNKADDMEHMADCLRRWTRDLRVKSLIPTALVMYKSLKQALKPHRLCPPSNNGYQVERRIGTV